MIHHRTQIRAMIRVGLAVACACALLGCGGNAVPTSQAAAPSAPPPPAPPADSTGGFDGQQAFRYVSDFVAIGPHSAGTDGDKRAQQYIIGKLKSFGCPVEEEDFTTPSPIGTVAMKNVIAKIPGASPDIVMLATHY